MFYYCRDNDVKNFNKFKEDLIANGYEVKVGKNGTVINVKGEEEKELSEMEENREIEKCLEGLVGIRLYKIEQSELAIKLNIRRNGNLKKSKDVINSTLKEDNIPYEIVDETDWDRYLDNGDINPNRGKKYWIVVES